MDKNAILAIGLTFAIFFGWQKLYVEPFQKQAMEVAQKQKVEREASLAKIAPAVAPTTIVAPGKEAVSNTPTNYQQISSEVVASNYMVKVANSPELVQGWELKSYYKALEKSEGKIDLGLVTGFSKQLSLKFKQDSGYGQLNAQPWSSVVNRNGDYVSTLTGAGAQLERSIRPSDGYHADLKYKLRFTNTPPAFVFVELLGNPKRPNDKEGSILGQSPDKVTFSFRDASGRTSLMADNLKATHEAMAGLTWLGIDTRYFVFAVAPALEQRKEAGVEITSGFVEGVRAVSGSVVIPTLGRKDFDVDLKVYFGPKHMENLLAADPALADAIDFGWTSFVAIPILRCLKWLYGFIFNYGIAIIVLTVGIKLLLYPLTYKSMKSMSKMAKLQPQLNALREKYKDDKEKLNTEMMSFMRTNGYNPIGGCLPILLQMPIFFALYRVLFNSIELYQAPFGLWIYDLSTPDPFYVTPVLLMGLMYIQQKLSPNTAADPMQQRMLQFMPVMFGVFMLMLPSGLTIYMVVNSVVSIAQQFYLNNKFGVYAAAKAAKLAKV